MGQTKFKYLNRSGYSIYWNNSWDSKNNYKKNFINFYFLDLFLNKIFKDTLFVKDYFFKKNKYNNFINKFFLKNVLFLKKNYFFKNRIKLLKVFNSKIWILNYQNWIVINVYVYISKKKFYVNNIKKKKNNLNPKKKNKYLNKFDFL